MWNFHGSLTSQDETLSMFHIFQFIFRNSFLSSITFLMQLETNVPKKKKQKKPKE